MNSKRLKKILFIFILLGACLFVARSYSSVPTAAANNSVVASSRSLPNDELERIHHAAPAGWFISTPKNFSSADLANTTFLYERSVFISGLPVPAALLPIKAYLQYNYPSHNFW